MKHFSALLILIGIYGISQAQHAKVVPSSADKQPEKTSFIKSQEFSLPCLGSRSMADVTTPWMRTVSSRRIVHGSPNQSALEQKKADKTRHKFDNMSRDQNPEVANPLATTPNLGKKFSWKRIVWRHSSRQLDGHI